MRLTTTRKKNEKKKRGNKGTDDENYDMNINQVNDESPYQVSFSKNRKSSEEWYVHLDTAYSSTSGDSSTTTQKRILQLRHSETGQYLYSDSQGNVACCSNPTLGTYWIVEPAVSSTPTSPQRSGSPHSVMNTPTRSGSSDTLPLTFGSSSFDNYENNSNSQSKNFNNLQIVLVSKEFPNRRLACGRKHTTAAMSSKIIMLKWVS